MDRRALIATLAVAGVVPATTVAVARSSAQSGQAEEKHIRDTLAAGAVALESSRMALSKARSPWVKKFAQYEVAEQETIAEVLKAMEPATTGAAPDSKSAAMQELSKAEGAQFDAVYIRAQLQGHTELLAIQDTYIKSGDDKAHVGIAKLARGQIKEHLDLIKTIQQQMKG